MYKRCQKACYAHQHGGRTAPTNCHWLSCMALCTVAQLSTAIQRIHGILLLPLGHIARELQHHAKHRRAQAADRVQDKRHHSNACWSVMAICCASILRQRARDHSVNRKQVRQLWADCTHAACNINGKALPVWQGHQHVTGLTITRIPRQ